MKILDKALILGAKIKNNLIKYRTKTLDGVEYYFDEVINDDNSIFVSGWIVSKKGNVLMPSIEFKTADETKDFPIKLTKREDVAAYIGVADSYCGFCFEATYNSCKTGRIYLKYCNNSKVRKIVIGAFKGSKNIDNLVVNEVISSNAPYFKVKDNITCDELNLSDKIYNYSVDIIVPVYNGFEYLEKLFSTIEKTKMKYRLFIVDDKSPDERVLPFLVDYAKDRKSVYLIENSTNLGFVQSVNKAMTVSNYDVAIVNTDVILPEMWLERLMFPIIMCNDVASSTPFTNSGTICSFPNFCENNNIFLDLDVDDIDSEFAKIKTVYNQMPTGVGFCMGMKRNVINEIGILNADVFYKGYGEENDWCQRAIKRGYKNVMVENLFVWHKHGGSFVSEDKQRYIERNLKLLNEMHPGYDRDVALYCKRDPVKNIREYVKFQLMFAQKVQNYIVFNHNWGGGAITYMNDKIKEYMSEGYGVIQIVNDVNYGLYLEYNLKGYNAKFSFADFNEIFSVISSCSCNNIIINELVSFENINETIDFALALKKHFNAKLTMLGHDYFALCPSIYLINNENNHCFKPDIEICRNCFEHNKNKFYNGSITIDEWRKIWEDFLRKCDEIILFSENTKSYFDYWYKDLSNIKVIPHKVNYIKPVEDFKKTSDTTTIAVIGNLMKTKGADIIYEMSGLIRKNNVNARIVVIGPDLDNCKDKDIIIHGKYKREELPELIAKYETDVVFIASIWPETFSYTTEEAMKMGVPVASFNIGAPSERIAKYSKGIIIENLSAKEALDKIMECVSK